MPTDALIAQDVIGSPTRCAACGGDADDRIGFMDNSLPSVWTCDDCHPAGGQPPREWLREEVLD